MELEDVPMSVQGRDAEQGTSRQTSSDSATASTSTLLEDRKARAGRTRPQRTDLAKLTPGTSQVEIFRDDGAHGWRGPAELLKLNEDKGTCIVEFNGKPSSLPPLRHIRPYRGSYFIGVEVSQEQERSLRELMTHVENSTSYTQHSLGYVVVSDEASGMLQWEKIPTEWSPEQSELYEKFVQTGKNVLHREAHGARFGRALQTIQVPKFSKGTLVSWPASSDQYLITESIKDSHLEEVSHIYFYNFHIMGEGGSVSVAPITSRTSRMMRVGNVPDLTAEPSACPQRRSVFDCAPNLFHNRHCIFSHSGWMTQQPRKICYKPTGLWTPEHEEHEEHQMSQMVDCLKHYHTEHCDDQCIKTTQQYLVHTSGPIEQPLFVDILTQDLQS